MKLIQHFLQNSLRNFNYLLISEENGDAIFFDPYDISQTMPLCIQNGGQAKYLMNTHYHHDHDRDNENLLNNYSVEEIKLKDGEIFKLSESEKIQCLFTPGHVMDHHCFLVYAGEKVDSIICGDTIFNAGMGNTRLGGDLETLYHTFKNIILPLEDHIKIYPSHDYFLTNLEFSLSVEEDNEETKKYITRRKNMNLDQEFLTTTIGEEKLYNPFFRAFNKDYQNKFDLGEKELFFHLRSLRDNW